MRNPAKTRICAGCGRKAQKSEFLRIGKSKDGTIDVADWGRGAYICKEISCLNAAIKKKRIASILRSAVPQEVYDKISHLIGSDNH